MDNFVTIVAGLAGVALLVMGITGGYNNLALIGIHLPGAAETMTNQQTKQGGAPSGQNQLPGGWLPFSGGTQTAEPPRISPGGTVGV